MRGVVVSLLSMKYLMNWRAAVAYVTVGRDKQLWVMAKFANGRKLESEKLYVTSQGVVSSTITIIRLVFVMSYKANLSFKRDCRKKRGSPLTLRYV